MENQMRDKEFKEFIKKHLCPLGLREFRAIDLSRGGTMLPDGFELLPAKNYKLNSYAGHNN